MSPSAQSQVTSAACKATAVFLASYLSLIILNTVNAAHLKFSMSTKGQQT